MNILETLANRVEASAGAAITIRNVGSQLEAIDIGMTVEEYEGLPADLRNHYRLIVSAYFSSRKERGLPLFFEVESPHAASEPKP